MRAAILITLFIVHVARIAESVHAETYYVSSLGDDSNLGSQAYPWRTMQKAADSMLPGDTASVMPGRYNEIVVSRKSGTAEARVSFRAGASEVIVSGFAISHAFHIIEGFEITGEAVAAYQGSVTVRRGGDSLLLRRNTFVSSPDRVHQLLVENSGAAVELLASDNKFLDARYNAVSISGKGHTISGNFFSNPHGWDAIRLLSSNTLISANTFQNWSNLTGNSNHADLIQSFDNNGEIAKHNVIERNIARDCVNCQIGNVATRTGENVTDWTWRNNVFSNVEMAMSISAPRMLFYNNVFYRSGRNSFGPLLFRKLPGTAEASDAQVYNNIFAECGSSPDKPYTGWYSVDAGVSGFKADYNLVAGRGSGMAKQGFNANGREVSGLNGFDPRFVNPAACDFRLRASSPCIGKGVNLSDRFKDDLTGTSRVLSWALGAHAHEVGKPTAPKSLMIVP